MTADLLIPAAQGLLALAMLLVAVLCIRLDRKLSALKTGKDGVAQAAGELAAAVSRAEAAIGALKAVSEDAARDLQERVEAARSTAEALKMLSTTARAVHAPPEPEPARVRRDDRTFDRDVRFDDDDLRDGRDDRRDAAFVTRRDPPGGGRWGGLR